MIGFTRERFAALAFGALAVGAAVAFPATAVADDLPPPPDPAPMESDPPPAGPSVPMLGALGPTGLNVLAQSNAAPAQGTLGAPPVGGLDQTSILGQNPVPLAPGAVAGYGAPPNLNVFNNSYGIQQYEVPSAPGGKQFDVAPGQENADVSRREWFGRYIDMQRAGRTYGGLGQRPQQQLGEPLPGTAPLPGTVIPAGPVQFLPDPADGPTPPPGLILPPPPEAPPGG